MVRYIIRHNKIEEVYILYNTPKSMKLSDCTYLDRNRIIYLYKDDAKKALVKRAQKLHDEAKETLEWTERFLKDVQTHN